MDFVREANVVSMTTIDWVIKCTPIAVVSLLALSIAGQDDLASAVSDVGVFVRCDLIALFCHLVLFYPLLLRLFVKANLSKYLLLSDIRSRSCSWLIPRILVVSSVVWNTS